MFNEGGVSVLQGGEVLEMEGGDASTTMRMYLMPLKCTLKNGENGQCYVMYSLPQLKIKIFKKKGNQAF